MPMLAVIRGLLGFGTCSRIAVAIASATLLRLLRVAARQDDRELVAADPRQHVGLAHAAAEHPAISSITRSPTGWPSESLTCLKLSRSSISSAPVRPVAAAARQLRVQVLLEAAPVLQPGQRVLAGLALQLLHPLVAAPDQDQRAEQSGQRDPEDRHQHRQADVGPVGVADDQQPGAVGDRDRGRGGVVERAVGPDTTRRPSAAARRRRPGAAEIAAAARSLMRKAPAAKPSSAARRWATVAVGAPSR